jgi:hypothetical protein
MNQGGRMGFADGLSALSFGKEQSIFSPQSFQKILGKAGQRDYPQSYKTIVDALKKAKITYTPRIGGSGADFDNVTKETIDIFNKEATKLRAEAGLQMTQYQATKIKKDIETFVKDKIKKGEYVSRPVIKEHFGLSGNSGDMLITRSLGVNEKAGTGLLKKLGQEEKKTTSKANFAKATATVMETKNEVLKLINNEFKLDPDLSNSQDLAKTIYGDKFPEGDMKNMSLKNLKIAESLVRQTDNDVMSYLRVIKGLRDKPDGMRLPTQNVINDITDNILSGIDDEAGDGQSFKKKSFRFSSGLLRDYKMALINKNLGLDPDTYRSERAKKILKNKNLDEIFSMSALADIAPGYTTKVQSIKKLINTKKASEIDLPFQRIINALNEGKTSMQLNKKIVPIEDAIKDFNKTSAKFSKKNKVQSPKINYNEKFDETILDSYGKASQKNIKKVYKDKNFFLSEIDPKIKTQDILKEFEAHGCKGKAAGGRILFSNGGEAVTTCATKGITRFIDDLRKGNYSKATLNLLKGGGNLIKSIANPMELLKLRNLIGPGAMGLMAAWEGGVITDDVIRQGTPLNESLANNWLTKAFLPYTKDYAKAKNLLETGKVPSNMKKYVQDVVTFNDALMDIKGIENRKDSRLIDDTGYGMIDGTSMYTKKQEQKDNADLMKKLGTLTEDVYTPGSAKALEMKSLQDEMEATRMAKKEFSPIFGFDKLKDVRTPGYTGFDYIPDEQPVDLRPITYQDAEYKNTKIPLGLEQLYMNKLGLKPRDSLGNYFFKDGPKKKIVYGERKQDFEEKPMSILEDLTDDYNKFQRQKKASRYPGYFGANENFSEGGIASLNVNKK